MSPLDGPIHAGPELEVKPPTDGSEFPGLIGPAATESALLTLEQHEIFTVKDPYRLRHSSEYASAKKKLDSLGVNYFNHDPDAGHETSYSRMILELGGAYSKMKRLSENSEYTEDLSTLEHGELYALTGLLGDSYALNGQHADRLIALRHRIIAVKNLWHSTTELYKAMSDLPEYENRDEWIKKIGVIEYIRGSISNEIGLDPNLEPGDINPNWYRRTQRRAVSPYDSPNKVEEYMQNLTQDTPRISEDSGYCIGDGKSIWTYGQNNIRRKIGPLSNEDLMRFFLPSADTEQQAA